MSSICINRCLFASCLHREDLIVHVFSWELAMSNGIFDSIVAVELNVLIM